MTKKQILDRIDEIASEFVSCSGVYGIKGYSKPRLAAMLVAYEQMATYNQKCFALLAENGYTQYDTIQFSLMGDHAPAWYKEYWQYKMFAIEIWRKQY